MILSRSASRQITLEAFVEARLPHWHRLLQDLIRIPSSSLGHEQAIVDFVARHIRSLGIEPQRVLHNPERLRTLPAAQLPIIEASDRYNLVVRIPGTGGGRSLAINTHLDTVPTGDPGRWTHAPLAGFIDTRQNIVYGRGAMDDKAGVTVSLMVLEAMVGLPLRFAGDVVFHYVLEDESTGNGTLLCLDAGYRADAALIIDGTRLDKAVNQHAGNLQFELRLTGKPASVSVSHLGVNAAEMLARLLLELRDAVLALNQQRTEPWTRFPSPFQLVTQKLHSEGAQLTVPEAAEAQCYVTFPPPFALATMQLWIERHVQAFAAKHALPDAVNISWNGFATEPVASPVGYLDDALQEAAKRQGFGAVDIGPSTGTSDLRHFVEAGIPCLLYGPGRGFNPHRPDEHYLLDDLPKMLAFYLEMAQAICGAAAPCAQQAA